MSSWRAHINIVNTEAMSHYYYLWVVRLMSALLTSGATRPGRGRSHALVGGKGRVLLGHALSVALDDSDTGACFSNVFS